MIIRLYVGYTWLTARDWKANYGCMDGDSGWHCLEGFMAGVTAAEEAGGVAGWYATFLENVVIPNSILFSYIVAWGGRYSLELD